MRKGEEQGPKENSGLSEAGKRKEVMKDTEKERPRRLRKGRNEENAWLVLLNG